MVTLLQAKERNHRRNLIVVSGRPGKSEARARSTMGAGSRDDGSEGDDSVSVNLQILLCYCPVGNAPMRL
ncbi:hypothetical protein RRF57_005172 [Xylaria bambusicola]|uniref:Uncharacterized protein n=1 Tax=Xylaria bambusicola TaxID=326684 RepID=A0AAN7UJD1_9PEZI